MFSIKIPAIFLACALLAGAATTATAGVPKTQAQAQNPFDITTEQSLQDQQAVITVRLATNNTVVLESNGTVIEVPGNVTQIDNDTLVVTPDNETVTELPGNVTVITPPEPEPCGCPVQNVTAPSQPIPPVQVQPAPGQNVTVQNVTIVAQNETGITLEGEGGGGGNETADVGVPQEPPQEPFPAVPGGNETTGGAATEEPIEGGAGTNETSGNGGDNQNNNNTALAPASTINQVLPWVRF